MFRMGEVIGPQGWASWLWGNIQRAVLHGGERFSQRKALGKAGQGSLWLKAYPSLLFWAKQELWGDSCPAGNLTVKRSRAEETLLFFPPPALNFIWIKVFGFSYTEQPRQIGFFLGPPWTSLRKAISSRPGVWLIQCLRHMSPAAGNFLLIASFPGSTENLRLSAGTGKQNPVQSELIHRG